ncbi:MAG: isoamylase early set domain-containing protein [Anaerolineales bacterium]|nr:isoamylase early set domain-containing protein [Anaerolineales bacterium]
MKKAYSKDRSSCRVTFELPAEIQATKVALCGDFNDWDKTRNMLTKRKDGRLSITLTLSSGTYRYRFLLDGHIWENDWNAEQYAPNDFGTEDSIVVI